MIRRHLSYANAAATLALAFAMSGGALAASHYLINSTKQINPRVLKSLKGRTGATGAAGTAGVPGKEGSKGTPGSPGANYTIQTTLESGQTERGVYSFWGTAPNSGFGFFGGAVNYRVPLAVALDASHVIFNPEESTSAHCSGPGHATSGYLCVYESNHGSRVFGNIDTPEGGTGGASATGFAMYFDTEGTNGGSWSYGSWAVTAP